MNIAAEYGVPVNLAATNDVIATTACTLIGFYVNSTSSGNITLRRGGSGGTVIGLSMTPAIGFHAFPASCPGGLHLTLNSGSINLTFFVIPGQS